MATRTELAIYKGLGISASICVLGWLLFPVFSGGHPPPYRTSCLSNVKQIGTGIAIYMADHDEWLPALQSPAGPTVVGWAQRVFPYVKSPDVFVDRLEEKELDEPERKRPRVSYAMNANAAAFPYAAIKVSESVSRSVLLYEVSGARQGRGGELASTLALSPAGDGAANGLLDTIDPNVLPLVRPATGPLDNSGLDPKSAGRHKGIANYGFLDTHAKALLPNAVSAGVNAAKPKDPQSNRGCRRPDLPGLSRPCAEGSANKGHQATFSLR